MSRIEKLFNIKTEKIIPFITAGYPSKDDTIDIVLAAEAAGAAMIELGIPFSDPLADGPIIQEANQVALGNGVTISWILKVVEEIRSKSSMPIALMGYINPIIKYGLKKFIIQCRNVGVDGLIIPDLPLDEAFEYIKLSTQNGICPVLLIAPNTSPSRIKAISGMTGLIYCVAILGITGSGPAAVEELKRYLIRVQENSSCPFIVGFGIKDRSDVMEINKLAHGAVVGSAIINKLKDADNIIDTTKEYIRKLIK